MTIDLAERIVLCAGVYLAIGAVIAAPFVWRGAGFIDHAARGAGAGFRLLLVPGVILLWPMILLRLASGRRVNAPIPGREEGGA